MKNKFSVEDAISKLWDKLDGWMEAIILKLPNLIMAILIMILFYFIAKVVKKVFKKYLLKSINQKSIQVIVSKIIFLIVILVGFFIALGVLELNKVLTSILAGAGVIGLAIGLALQGTLSNTFGGLILSFMPKIKINDYIETDSVKGFVSEISLRNIVLRRPDNNYVIIPNSKFVDNAFTNYSLSPRSRISVSCGIGYESNLQEVEDLVIRIISENFEQKEGEKVEFFFTEFGDSSINFITRFWIDMVKSKEKYEETHKAIKLIKSNFDKQGINIPFPIRTLDFSKNTMQIKNNNKEEK
ncbi:mechanosensitive ion channel family protein [Xanthomarina sp. F2636L]|uniref:mechanosensitive ion channel family protein n=1 Tax=Xanthomarina sp. F2636L TaxID=2996018 RepID=UPI00225E399B|nr:mechanosensitive ion channel family protein [Xanthomarina sp. F2636L]MCX7550078.1 mechanosensitive ion channel family protein [Xanthomarina sp. F2636L]